MDGWMEGGREGDEYFMHFELVGVASLIVGDFFVLVHELLLPRRTSNFELSNRETISRARPLRASPGTERDAKPSTRHAGVRKLATY